MGAYERNDSQELRYDYTRLIPFSSRLLVTGWDTYLNDPTPAGAILDRVVPLSQKIERKAVRSPRSHRAPPPKGRTATAATRSAGPSGAS